MRTRLLAPLATTGLLILSACTSSAQPTADSTGQIGSNESAPTTQPDTSEPGTAEADASDSGQDSASQEWTRTNPGGGGTMATVGATASGLLVAASDLSGAYRSADDGESWTPLGFHQGLGRTHTTSLGFHPSDGDTFFVGTGWGAFKTSNGGDLFEMVQEDGYIEGFSFPTANSRVGYMAYHEDWDTPGEVWKSTDAGDSWRAVEGENLPDIRIVKVLAHPLDEDVVYALGGKTRWGCSDAHLYRSADGGAHWNRIGSEFGSILDFDVDPTNTETVFLTTFKVTGCAPDQVLDDYLFDDVDAGEFYKSSDEGVTWTQLSDQTGIISVDHDPQTIRIMTVLFPFDWNDDAGTWLTTDGGDTWEQSGNVTDWNVGWSTNQYFALSASFNGYSKTITKDIFRPERMLASFGSWAWASSDGGAILNNISTREVSPGHWQSTGVENIVGHGLAVSEANPDVIYLGAYDIGLWTSIDRGLSWKRSLPDHQSYPDFVWAEGQGSNVTAVVADPEIKGTVWAVFHREGFGNGGEFESGTNSALFKSTDFGETWKKNDDLPDARFFYGLTIDRLSPTGERTMFMTVEGDVVRSSDNGETWDLMLSQGGLKFTAVDHHDSQLVYAGGENGLWRSSNAGEAWEEVGLTEMHGPLVGNFLPTEDGWEGVFDVVTDPTVPDRVYVIVYGADKGLYRSDDRGETWIKLFENSYMRGVAVSNQDPDLIYATSSDSYHSGGVDFEQSAGIIRSTDGGQTWQSVSADMAWPYGGRVVIAPGPDPYVIAWSPGTGLQMGKTP